MFNRSLFNRSPFNRTGTKTIAFSLSVAGQSYTIVKTTKVVVNKPDLVGDTLLDIKANKTVNTAPNLALEGLISSAPNKTVIKSVDMEGENTLSALVSRTKYTALAGGSIIAVTGTRILNKSVDLANSGTVNAVINKVVSIAPNLTGDNTLVVTKTRILNKDSIVIGDSSLGIKVSKIIPGIIDVLGENLVSVNITRPRYADLLGEGSLNVYVTKVLTTVPNLTGDSLVIVKGIKIVKPAPNLSMESTIDVKPNKMVMSKPDLALMGTLVVKPTKTVYGIIDLYLEGAMSPTLTRPRFADLAGDSSISVTCTRSVQGSADLVGVNTLGVVVNKIVKPAPNLIGTSTLSISCTRELNAPVLSNLEAYLSIKGTKIIPSIVDLLGESLITAVNITRPRYADILGDSSLSVTTTRVLNTAPNLSGSATLAVSALKFINSAPTLSMESGVVVRVNKTVYPHPTLVGESVLDAQGVKSRSIVLNNTTDLSISTAKYAIVKPNLAGGSSLVAKVNKSVPSKPSMSGQSGVTVDANVIINEIIGIAGVTSLVTKPNKIVIPAPSTAGGVEILPKSTKYVPAKALLTLNGDVTVDANVVVTSRVRLDNSGTVSAIGHPYLFVSISTSGSTNFLPLNYRQFTYGLNRGFRLNRLNLAQANHYVNINKKLELSGESLLNITSLKTANSITDLSNAGLLTVKVTKIVIPKVNMSAEGSITTKQLKTVQGNPNLVGESAIVARPIRAGYATLAGISTLNVTTTRVAINRPITLLGNLDGSISTIKEVRGNYLLTNTALMDIDPSVAVTSSIIVGGESILTIKPNKTVIGNINVVSEGIISTTSTRILFGSPTITNETNITNVLGHRLVLVKLDLAGESKVAPIQTRILFGSSRADNELLISAKVTRLLNTNVELSGDSLITVKCTRIVVFYTSTLSGNSGVSPTPTKYCLVTPILSGDSTIVGTPNKLVKPVIGMSGSTGLQISSNIVVNSSINIAGTSDLVVKVIKTTPKGILLQLEGIVSPNYTRPRYASIQGESNVTPIRYALGIIDVLGKSVVSVTPTKVVNPSVQMSGASSEIVKSLKLVTGIASLDLLGTLLIKSTRPRYADLAGETVVIPVRYTLAKINMLGESLLSIIPNKSVNINVGMLASTTVEVKPLKTIPGSVLINLEGNIYPTPSRPKYATIEGQTSINAVRYTIPTVDFSGNSSLDIVPNKAVAIKIDLLGNSLLTVDGNVVVNNNVNIEGNNLLAVKVVKAVPKKAQISGDSSILVATQVAVKGMLDLSLETKLSIVRYHLGEINLEGITNSVPKRYRQFTFGLNRGFRLNYSGLAQLNHYIDVYAKLAVAGDTYLVVTGTKLVNESTIISGETTLAVKGAKVSNHRAVATGDTSLSIKSLKIVNNRAQAQGNSDLLVKVTRPRFLSPTGNLELAVNPTRVLNKDVSITGESSVGAYVLRIATKLVSIEGNTNLTLDANSVIRKQIQLTGDTYLLPKGNRASNALTTLQGSTELLFKVTKVATPLVIISNESYISAKGIHAVYLSALGDSTLTPNPTKYVNVVVGLVNSGSALLIPTKCITASVLIQSDTNLEVGTRVSVNKSMNLLGESLLDVKRLKIANSTANLTSTGAIIIEATKVVTSKVSMSTEGGIVTKQLKTIQGSPNIVGESKIVARPIRAGYTIISGSSTLSIATTKVIVNKPVALSSDLAVLVNTIKEVRGTCLLTNATSLNIDPSAVIVRGIAIRGESTIVAKPNKTVVGNVNVASEGSLITAKCTRVVLFHATALSGSTSVTAVLDKKIEYTLSLRGQTKVSIGRKAVAFGTTSIRAKQTHIQQSRAHIYGNTLIVPPKVSRFHRSAQLELHTQLAVVSTKEISTNILVAGELLMESNSVRLTTRNVVIENNTVASALGVKICKKPILLGSDTIITIAYDKYKQCTELLVGDLVLKAVATKEVCVPIILSSVGTLNTTSVTEILRTSKLVGESFITAKPSIGVCYSVGVAGSAEISFSATKVVAPKVDYNSSSQCSIRTKKYVNSSVYALGTTSLSAIPCKLVEVKPTVVGNLSIDVLSSAIAICTVGFAGELLCSNNHVRLTAVPIVATGETNVSVNQFVVAVGSVAFKGSTSLETNQAKISHHTVAMENTLRLNIRQIAISECRVGLTGQAIVDAGVHKAYTFKTNMLGSTAVDLSATRETPTKATLGGHLSSNMLVTKEAIRGIIIIGTSNVRGDVSVIVNNKVQCGGESSLVTSATRSAKVSCSGQTALVVDPVTLVQKSICVSGNSHIAPVRHVSTVPVLFVSGNNVLICNIISENTDRLMLSATTDKLVSVIASTTISGSAIGDINYVVKLEGSINDYS